MNKIRFGNKEEYHNPGQYRRRCDRLSFPGIITIFFLLTALTLSGCGDSGGKRLGKPVPKDAEVISLSAVMASPAEYNGKTVKMKGMITGQCASLCEFFFKDGVHRATIYPQGYEFPKLPVGKPVTVYAQVTSGEEQVVFSALGVELE